MRTPCGEPNEEEEKEEEEEEEQHHQLQVWTDAQLV